MARKIFSTHRKRQPSRLCSPSRSLWPHVVGEGPAGRAAAGGTCSHPVWETTSGTVSPQAPSKRCPSEMTNTILGFLRLFLKAASPAPPTPPDEKAVVGSFKRCFDQKGAATALGRVRSGGDGGFHRTLSRGWLGVRSAVSRETWPAWAILLLSTYRLWWDPGDRKWLLV